jgi:hypothetical protein
MEKIHLLVIFGIILLNSCSNKIEKDTTKILVTYNKSISEHRHNVQKIKDAFAPIGLSKREQNALLGTSWIQDNWNEIRTKYKIDSLENDFLEKYGEDEFNILSLKTSENFENKMNSNNHNYIKTSP